MGGHCGVNLLSVPLMFLPCKTKEKDLSPLFKDPDDRPRGCTLCYYLTHHRRESGEICLPAPYPGCHLETVSGSCGTATCGTATDLHDSGGRLIESGGVCYNIALRNC